MVAPKRRDPPWPMWLHCCVLRIIHFTIDYLYFGGQTSSKIYMEWSPNLKLALFWQFIPFLFELTFFVFLEESKSFLEFFFEFSISLRIKFIFLPTWLNIFFWFCNKEELKICDCVIFTFSGGRRKVDFKSPISDFTWIWTLSFKCFYLRKSNRKIQLGTDFQK